MLSDIEFITLRYLLTVKNIKFHDVHIKLVWYKHKRYGKGYEYNNNGALIGKWTYDVKKEHSVGPSMDLDGNGNITQVNEFDHNGNLLETKEYYDTGELHYRKIDSKEYWYYKNGLLIYDGEHSWDENGNLTAVKIKGKWCCML